MARKGVRRDEIVVNTPLPWDVYDAQGRLLLRRGYVIESQHQMDRLINGGLYHLDDGPDDQAEPLSAAEPRSLFDLIDEVYNGLQRMLDDRSPIEDFPQRLFALSQSMRQICDLDPDAALSTIFMQEHTGRYTVNHPIDTAILCYMVSKRLGLTAEAQQSILSAALTMNIAIVALQERLSHQRGRLSSDQQQEIHSHPERGAAMLREYGVTDEACLDVVHRHHEYANGQGYPRGLGADQIPQLARILTIADIVSAKVTPRSYRASLLSDVGLREMFLGTRGECVDQDILAVFIKEVGVYPPGTLVRLVHGEIAVVTQRGQQAHCPVVHIIAGKHRDLLPEPRRRDSSDQDFAIKETLGSNELGLKINRSQLWKPGRSRWPAT